MLHTFAICAYQESPYLEECILSLRAQSVASEILIATSTPNAYIEELAGRYGLPVYVNTGEHGITQDWNFALSQVKTKYATIAHQDDLYEPEYTEWVVGELEKTKRPIIGFTDYYETRNGLKVTDSRFLHIKRLMLAPLKPKCFRGSRFVRRRSLSLGDAICCPSVCFCLENVKQPVFHNKYRSAEDWEAWEKLSRQKGAFVYVPQMLMSHRIHEDSATTAIIKDHARIQENYEMYCKFWPPFMARLINHFYTGSEKSNTL